MEELFCCDILCPNLASEKISYSPKLDLGEMGYTFSCADHIESLKLSQEDFYEKI